MKFSLLEYFRDLAEAKCQSVRRTTLRRKQRASFEAAETASIESEETIETGWNPVNKRSYEDPDEALSKNGSDGSEDDESASDYARPVSKAQSRGGAVCLLNPSDIA